LLLTVSASEILAAWKAAQAQQQEGVAPLDAAALQAAEQPSAQAQPSSWIMSCTGIAGHDSRGSASEVPAVTCHRAKRVKTMAAEGPATDSSVLTAAAAAAVGAAVEPAAAAAWPAAVAAAAAWLSDAAAAAAACGIS
jgi:hypothetical protein